MEGPAARQYASTRGVIGGAGWQAEQQIVKYRPIDDRKRSCPCSEFYKDLADGGQIWRDRAYKRSFVVAE